MNTKTKLNEAAKDLGVSNQELIDLIEKEMKVVKKPTAVMTTEEMTFVLEYYSQKNQVKDFNSYFDSRNQPKQEKKPFFGIPGEERRAMIAAADGTLQVDKWLMDNFSGLSPLIARELAHRCGGDYTNLADAADALAESVLAGELEPYMISMDGKPCDFSFMAISQYGAQAQLERFGSYSEMQDAFYSARDRAEQQRHRSHDLTKTVRTLRDRLR